MFIKPTSTEVVRKNCAVCMRSAKIQGEKLSKMIAPAGQGACWVGLGSLCQLS